MDPGDKHESMVTTGVQRHRKGCADRRIDGGVETPPRDAERGQGTDKATGHRHGGRWARECRPWWPHPGNRALFAEEQDICVISGYVLISRRSQ